MKLKKGQKVRLIKIIDDKGNIDTKDFYNTYIGKIGIIDSISKSGLYPILVSGMRESGILFLKEDELELVNQSMKELLE
jgi:hypothetical protein